MTAVMTFKRYELKYLMDEEQAEAVQRALQERLAVLAQQTPAPVTLALADFAPAALARQPQADWACSVSAKEHYAV